MGTPVRAMASIVARGFAAFVAPTACRHMSSRATISYSQSGHSLEPLSGAQLQELSQDLPEPQRKVLITMQTETPWSGTTSNGYRFDSNEAGTYVCAMGGLPVFHSRHKGNYGLGYATFWRPIDVEHVSHNLLMMGHPMNAEEWPLSPEAAKKNRRERGLSSRGSNGFENRITFRLDIHGVG